MMIKCDKSIVTAPNISTDDDGDQGSFPGGAEAASTHTKESPCTLAQSTSLRDVFFMF